MRRCPICGEVVRWPDDEPKWSPCCGGPMNASVTIINPDEVPPDHVVVISGTPVIVHRVADSIRQLPTEAQPEKKPHDA